MAYADFTLSGLTKQFGVTIDAGTDLFADVPEVALRPAFQEQLAATLPLALVTSTGKSRSEFIIAPVLGELWLLAGRKIGVLSGVDFSVDSAQGLAGVCEYIITRSPGLLFVKAPILMLVEAKNEELKRGYAQCIAEMLAAQTFNALEGEDGDRVYGAVTIGELWKFLALTGTTVRLDAHTYHIEHIDKIMGILLYLVTGRGEPQEPGG